MTISVVDRAKIGASPTSATEESTMSKILSGKVALVTGGSRGLGAATAAALADRGADVAIGYVASRELAENVVKALRTKGVRADAIHVDQGDPKASEPLMHRVVEIFGKL